MILLYLGKTKNVYDLEDGRFLLKFKDDATGEDGVFDPGSNQVGLTISGAGKAGLKMTAYYMNILNSKGFKTHFISADLDSATMTVHKATRFGHGLEVVCRFRAYGSFIRRYGEYIKPGDPLPDVVEITLKDDKRDDPLINKEALAALNILKPAEYDVLSEMAKKICRIIRDDLAQKGMDLCDIKLEFGRVASQIYLIDEISGGNMRVFKDGKLLEPLDLSAKATE
ncbi:MAG: phosphoribosylaminoimidazolesuccinocarboxamide synthase [Peptococcaceae bacterium]|jgi:phosphoribosylaminoimidazole-succinocarboxamide synthase|nr:phosphoribosylaminoimidazolesuccinocarboxamide synthase [Peptococcaceae bacterium]